MRKFTPSKSLICSALAASLLSGCAAPLVMSGVSGFGLGAGFKPSLSGAAQVVHQFDKVEYGKVVSIKPTMVKRESMLDAAAAFVGALSGNTNQPQATMVPGIEMNVQIDGADTGYTVKRLKDEQEFRVGAGVAMLTLGGKTDVVSID